MSKKEQEEAQALEFRAVTTDDDVCGYCMYQDFGLVWAEGGDEESALVNLEKKVREFGANTVVGLRFKAYESITRQQLVYGTARLYARLS